MNENESKAKTNVLSSNAVKYCCQLSKSVMADVIITGPDISAKDIEMLRKYLELTKDALEDNNSHMPEAPLYQENTGEGESDVCTCGHSIHEHEATYECK